MRKGFNIPCLIPPSFQSEVFSLHVIEMVTSFEFFLNHKIMKVGIVKAGKQIKKTILQPINHHNALLFSHPLFLPSCKIENKQKKQTPTTTKTDRFSLRFDKSSRYFLCPLSKVCSSLKFLSLLAGLGLQIRGEIDRKSAPPECLSYVTQHDKKKKGETKISEGAFLLSGARLMKME